MPHHNVGQLLVSIEHHRAEKTMLGGLPSFLAGGVHSHQRVALRKGLAHQRKLRQPHRGIDGGVWTRPSPTQLHHGHAHLTHVVRSQHTCMRCKDGTHHRRLGQHLLWPLGHSGISPHMRDALGEQFQGPSVL